MPSNRNQKRKSNVKAAKQAQQEHEAELLSQQSQWVIYPSDEEDEEDDSGSDLQDEDDHPNVPLVDLQTTAESLMSEVKDDAMSPRVEKFLDLLIWSIPLTSLYVLLDIMIHQQYAMHPTFAQEFGRIIGTAPILVAIIWLTTISPKIPPKPLQLLLFVASIVLGSSFIWVYHQSPYMEVVRRTPPLATLWIYSVVKLDLVPCVASVAAVGGFVWWNALPLWSHQL